MIQNDLQESIDELTKKTGKISTGSNVLDDFLGGGIEKNIITTIYGPAGSGKSNIGLNIIADILKKGKKAIFIDTEGSFSVERMLQIYPDFRESSQKLLFLKPTNFQEQKEAFEILHSSINVKKEPFSVIVIDSIAMLYRLEIGKSKDVYNVNRELGRQLGMLTELSRKRGIPVVIMNQVYSDFESDAIKMVGGDLLKYSSKCLIELKNAKNNMRCAKLKKHRSLPEEKDVSFRIVDKGIEGA
ncbi:MAG: DNA repair and recombination protein RadB [Nanobdellota archaeon]